MPDTLQQTGQSPGHEIRWGWQSRPEGGCESPGRSRNAVTHFKPEQSRQTLASIHHLLALPAGAFQIAAPLPCSVAIAPARVESRHGVLTPRLPKREGRQVASTALH